MQAALLGMIERGLTECVGSSAKWSNSEEQSPVSLGLSNASTPGNAAIPSGDGATAVSPSTLVVRTSAQQHELEEKDTALATVLKLAEAAETEVMTPTVGLAKEGSVPLGKEPDVHDCDEPRSADRNSGDITTSAPISLDTTSKENAEVGLSEFKASVWSPDKNGLETGDSGKCCSAAPVEAGCDPLSRDLENEVDWEDYDVIALEAGGSTLAVLSDEAKAPRLTRTDASVEATHESVRNRAVSVTSAASFVPTVSPTSLRLDDAGFPLAIFTKVCRMLAPVSVYLLHSGALRSRGKHRGA